MPHRVRVRHLSIGENILPPDQAHHVRDVLRLRPPQGVELFTDDGFSAAATLAEVRPEAVVAVVESITPPPGDQAPLRVAAAVPKGNRADWMVEKLSEVGVGRFIPLATERAVSLPEGRNKLERWRRLAIESAKQCRRVGVMAVDPLTKLSEAIAAARSAGIGRHLSTDPDAPPLAMQLPGMEPGAALTLFIGPEGDWTGGEVEAMNEAGLTGAGLTTTILRTETAAVVAAAVAGCIRRPIPPAGNRS